MKPARALLFKNLFPVDLSRLELRNRSVAAIRAANRSPQAKAAFGEIKTVANFSSYAIKLHPARMALIHSTLIDQVFHQMAHGIVRKSSHYSSAQVEAAFQAARDVVFTSAFPHAEITSSRNYPIAGIKTQHDLAQAHHGPAATCR